MIRDEGGRFQSYRTVEDYKSILLSELKALNDDERDIAILALQDYLNEGRSPLVEIGSSDIYRTLPVSITEWIENDYYLGSLSKTIFPTVKSDLIEVFEGGYSIAIWGGSIGGGKTSTIVLCLMRMLYELSCMISPHKAYGVNSSDFITIPCLSSTEEVANRNLVSKVSAIIEDAPYFKYDFKPIKSTQSGILFKNRLLIPPGASTASSVIGSNAIGAIIDESNFFQNRHNADSRGNESKENIDIVFESLQRRIESRFLNKGKMPGLIAVASSKTTPTSFTERAIRRSVTDPRVFVRERSVWEAVNKERFSGDRFKVAIGNEYKQSRILVPGEEDPEGMKVIDVPVEYYSSFETDIDAAIRDYAGYFTAAITPFIARREKILECVDPNRKHPMPYEVWEQDRPLVIDWSKLVRTRSDGAFEPIHNPSAVRHIHLDLSKNHDRTGVVMGHVSRYVPVQRLGNDGGEMAPMIEVDFALAIQAPVKGEIIYAEIRKLIYELSRHGFYIKVVSADQFQSLALLQSVKAQGYLTQVVSVETAGGPYEVMKTALYENRLSYYNYPPMMKELRELQKNWKSGKVDHPPAAQGGSKDVTDALAAISATLTKANYYAEGTSVVVERSSEPLQNDEAWVLDDPGTVVALDSLNDARPEWRKHGESMLQERQSGAGFVMPFITG